MEAVPKQRDITPKDDLGPQRFEMQTDNFVGERLDTEQVGTKEMKEGDLIRDTAEAYETYEEPLEVQQYHERKKEYNDAIAQWDGYIQKVTAEDESVCTEEELHYAIDMRERMKQEMVEVSANYPGDWTSLFYQRLTNPSTKEKFMARRTEAMEYMKEDSREVGRREMPRTHYQDQIDNYDSNIAQVFARTEIGSAETFGMKPNNLGTVGNENVGAVFTDAEHHGTPLTNRQKNIIEAHEKGHCLRDFASPLDRDEIRRTVDGNKIAELNAKRLEAGRERASYKYLNDPMEIVERMAQFKNYFGMNGDEPFTKKHLEHIKKHYVIDTGLDNNVSDLLFMVTPETEPRFLEVINKYPV